MVDGPDLSRVPPTNPAVFYNTLSTDVPKSLPVAIDPASPPKINPLTFLRAIFFSNNPLEQIIPFEFPFPDEFGAPKRIEQKVTFVDASSVNKVKTATLPEDREAIQAILPTIVRVSAKTADNQGWFGSGAIVNPSDVLPGYIPQLGEYFILTNNHVAEGAKYLTVRLPNGVEYFADVVESTYNTRLMDDGQDIAILRVYIPASLPCAKIGNSDQLETGQTVYTAGHPLALPETSITKGIVSNPHQNGDIQSDAPISPGNSGGPMFTSNGEIVGLTTYTFRGGEDTTFAKPINRQLEVIRRIWNEGEYVRGSLGFEVKGFPLIERKLAGFPEEKTGALIESIEKGSAADKAGLAAGDVVTEINAYGPDGKIIKTLRVDITDAYEADSIIKQWTEGLAPGTRVKMTVFRKIYTMWFPMTIDLKVGKFVEKKAIEATRWGLSITKADSGGILISGVDDKSPAAENGIEAGKYFIRGVESDAIPIRARELASNIHSLSSLDDLFALLNAREVDRITLVLADVSNPKKIRRVTLTRNIVDESFWENGMEKSWQTTLALN